MIPLECPLHVTYEAFGPPETDCKICWYLWRVIAQVRVNGVVVKRK